MRKILGLMVASVAFATASNDANVLRRGDALSIQVPGWREFGGTNLRIDESGGIYLVTIGRVEASGKTVAELAHEIEQRLGEVVLEPRVLVTR
jgi:protein involved in polysaccharide export with SLBB domain